MTALTRTEQAVLAAIKRRPKWEPKRPKEDGALQSLLRAGLVKVEDGRYVEVKK